MILYGKGEVNSMINKTLHLSGKIGGHVKAREREEPGELRKENRSIKIGEFKLKYRFQLLYVLKNFTKLNFVKLRYYPLGLILDVRY